MQTRHATPQPLTLTTLSSTYEASRIIVVTTKIEIASTYDRLAQQLQNLIRPKGREDLIKLYHALDRLDRASLQLGLTTLINPADHPLVIRHEARMPKDKK